MLTGMPKSAHFSNSGSMRVSSGCNPGLWTCQRPCPGPCHATHRRPARRLDDIFEFPYGGRTESRPVIASVVEAAPHFEAVRILGVLTVNGIKLRAGSIVRMTVFSNAYLVHGVDPFVNLLRSFGVGMRVHIDDRIFGPGNLRHRNFVDGFRPVILEENCFW